MKYNAIKENKNVMKYTFEAPETIKATINLPASKSISNRALIIYALSGGTVIPENLSDCDDTDVLMKALRDMPDVIDIKASGTAMRFLTAYLSVADGEHIITGTDRMKQRPIRVLVDALRNIGADITYEGQDGYPPLRIRGRQLRGGHVEVSGDVSSQYISALLMIGPNLVNGIELKLIGDIVSRPYIDLTLCTMKNFGADAEWADVSTVVVKPSGYKPDRFFIENDWSAASYWYEMVALSRSEDTEVRLQGLTDGSRQGDSAVKYLFSMLGVKTVFGTREQGVPTEVTLRRMGRGTTRLDYDFSNQPDLAQTFVVCCALMDVKFRFRGLASLKIKETDRVAALKTEMRKLGFVVRETGAGELSWNGERCQPADDMTINTYEDHRMAMAFAPAAIVFPQLRINNPEVVSKSYPHFWKDLGAAGFVINKED